MIKLLVYMHGVELSLIKLFVYMHGVELSLIKLLVYMHGVELSLIKLLVYVHGVELSVIKLLVYMEWKFVDSIDIYLVLEANEKPLYRLMYSTQTLLLIMASVSVKELIVTVYFCLLAVRHMLQIKNTHASAGLPVSNSPVLLLPSPNPSHSSTRPTLNS